MTESTQILKLGKIKSKNLLIVNKGPSAVRLDRNSEDWDLLEIYFHPDDYKKFIEKGSDADYVVFETDRFKRKFKIIQVITEMIPSILQYQNVMMIDDDLVPVNCTIEEIFELFESTGFRVGQPALTRDSFWSHYILLKDNRFAWRLTNFVEVMCPIMRNDAFKEYLKIFDENISAFGFDNFWSYQEWINHGGVVVLDKTPMRHCRPVRGGTAYQGLSEAKEKNEFFERHHLENFRQLVLAGMGDFSKKYQTIRTPKIRIFFDNKYMRLKQKILRLLRICLM